MSIISQDQQNRKLNRDGSKLIHANYKSTQKAKFEVLAGLFNLEAMRFSDMLGEELFYVVSPYYTYYEGDAWAWSSHYSNTSHLVRYIWLSRSNGRKVLCWSISPEFSNYIKKYNKQWASLFKWHLKRPHIDHSRDVQIVHPKEVLQELDKENAEGQELRWCCYVCLRCARYFECTEEDRELCFSK